MNLSKTYPFNFFQEEHDNLESASSPDEIDSGVSEDEGL